MTRVATHTYISAPRVVSCALLLASVGAAAGCSSDNRTILSGKVIDLSEAPLSGVSISLDPPATASPQTDPDGTYSVLLSADTQYTVTARKDGYRDEVTTLPVLAPGETATRDFTLRGTTCEPNATSCPTETAIGTCNSAGTAVVEAPCGVAEFCNDAGGRATCTGNDACVLVPTGLDNNGALVVMLNDPQLPGTASISIKNEGRAACSAITVEKVGSSDFLQITQEVLPALDAGVRRAIDVTVTDTPQTISDRDSAEIGTASMRLTDDTGSLVLTVPIVVRRNLDCTDRCMGANNGFGGVCSVSDCDGCCNGSVCIPIADQTDEQCRTSSSDDECTDCSTAFDENHSCAEVGSQRHCECSAEPEISISTTPDPVNCTGGNAGMCSRTTTNVCDPTATTIDCVSCACNSGNCATGCCDGDRCVGSPTNTQCPEMQYGSACVSCSAPSVCFNKPDDNPDRDHHCCAPNCSVDKCEGDSDGCGGTCTTVTNAPARCAPRIEGGGFQTVGGGSSGNVRIESPSFSQAGSGCSGTGPMQVCIKHGRLE